jgi:hypothetical protein
MEHISVLLCPSHIFNTRLPFVRSNCASFGLGGLAAGHVLLGARHRDRRGVQNRDAGNTSFIDTYGVAAGGPGCRIKARHDYILSVGEAITGLREMRGGISF